MWVCIDRHRTQYSAERRTTAKDATLADVDTVEVVPGEGLIAHSPGIVIGLGALPPGGVSVAAELFSLVERYDGRLPAENVAWQITGTVAMAGGARRCEPFGVAIAIEHGHVLLLGGNVWAHIDTPPPGRLVSSNHALTVVEAFASPDSLPVSVGLTRAAAHLPDAGAPLYAGVEHGGGFIVRRADASVQFESDSVPTLAAPRGRWVLYEEGGVSIVLDNNYVLGRDPADDADVRSGRAIPIAISDAEHLISRVQVRIDVTNGLVLLRDGGSRNGTFVAAPGMKEWMRIGREPVPLRPGWSMRIGQRVFVQRFEE